MFDLSGQLNDFEAVPICPICAAKVMVKFPDCLFQCSSCGVELKHTIDHWETETGNRVTIFMELGKSCDSDYLDLSKLVEGRQLQSANDIVYRIMEMKPFFVHGKPMTANQVGRLPVGDLCEDALNGFIYTAEICRK